MSASSSRDQVWQLFDAHSEELLAFLRAQLPLAPDDAQDLLQQTFLELKTTLDKPNAPEIENPRAYLFQIARFRLYRHIRAMKRAEELFVARESTDDPEAEHHDTEYLANLRADLRLLLRAMRRLPLEQQITIHLYYITGLPAPAIAFATERPESTIRGQLRLGLNSMRHTVGTLKVEVPEKVVETTTGTLESWWAELKNSVQEVEDTEIDDE